MFFERPAFFIRKHRIAAQEPSWEKGWVRSVRFALLSPLLVLIRSKLNSFIGYSLSQERLSGIGSPSFFRFLFAPSVSFRSFRRHAADFADTFILFQKFPTASKRFQDAFRIFLKHFRDIRRMLRKRFRPLFLNALPQFLRYSCGVMPNCFLKHLLK